MTRKKDPDDIKLRISKTELIEIIEDTVSQFDLDSVYWLDDDDYKKAIAQLRMNVAGIFDFMKVDDRLPIRYMYGLGDFIQTAIEEIVKLTEDFGLRVRGIDKNISLELIRRKKIRDFSNTVKEVEKEVLKNVSPGKCPECGNTLIFEEGCNHCVACGYSKC